MFSLIYMRRLNLKLLSALALSILSCLMGPGCLVSRPDSKVMHLSQQISASPGEAVLPLIWSTPFPSKEEGNSKYLCASQKTDPSKT
mmetsp:Transcript_34967/g.51127  ORF Transcript_34967/g.51127 Transcript_34967/m.51127 type:complete len:87 (+) Transcript_34967:315-575(+)